MKIRPRKKVSVFQFTWNFKIGTIGRFFFFFFFQNFFMGIIGKQYFRIEKIPQNPLKIKKKVWVDSEKLGMVG